MDIKCAVKVIYGDGIIKPIERELIALTKLRHPNIIHCYGYNVRVKKYNIDFNIRIFSRKSRKLILY